MVEKVIKYRSIKSTDGRNMTKYDIVEGKGNDICGVFRGDKGKIYGSGCE